MHLPILGLKVKMTAELVLKDANLLWGKGGESGGVNDLAYCLNLPPRPLDEAPIADGDRRDEVLELGKTNLPLLGPVIQSVQRFWSNEGDVVHDLEHL